jgi:lipopolysaccharide export system permease protein
MGDAASTDYQSHPSLKERLGARWHQALSAIRRVPYLTSAFALAALAVFCWITYQDGNKLLADTPEGWARRYQVAMFDTSRTNLLRDFFHSHWKLGALLFLPALLLAIIRQRGRKFVLALTLVTLAVLGRWSFDEISTGWEPAHNSLMGEIPSPYAFYWKLALIATTFLSLPLMLWLYFRSTILDRYVVRSFVAPFLMCLLGIIAIMITMDLLNNANDFLKAGFSIGRVIVFYLTQVPQILVMITDAAVLLATLYTLSRMSRSNEIVSMLGSGRSLIRILVPILTLGAWASLVIMAMNYAWAPGAQSVKDEMLRQADAEGGKSRRDEAATYNVMFRNRDEHRTWFLGKVPAMTNAEENKIEFVAVLQDDGAGNLQKAWYARRGVWMPNERQWKLHQASVIDSNTLSSDTPVIQQFDKLIVEENWPETPWSILSGKVNPDFLSVPELTSYLRSSLTLEANKLARYETTLHGRFSLPFRCFLMVLIAAPLGIVTSRRGVLGGVAWSVALFVIVYFLYTIGLKLAEVGYITPATGAWSVVAGFAAIGIALLWMKNYNRQFPSLNPLRWFK